MSSSSLDIRGSSSKTYEAMSIKDLRILLTLRGYDCSQCLEKTDLIATARRLDATNYDEEAHKLFRELNIKPTAAPQRYSNLDPIWKHPEAGGGSVYVGNYIAASDRRTLRERNIVAVVNCQDEKSDNYFEDDGDMHYHRFVVSRLAIKNRNAPLQGGFQEAFDFIQHHIQRGDSVLIHCLAGAHRAGTVGTGWLMYKTGKGVKEAITLARKCRSLVHPFGTLLELLHHLENDLKKSTSCSEQVVQTKSKEDEDYRSQ